MAPGLEKLGDLGGGRHAMSLLLRPCSFKVLNLLAEQPMSANELVAAVPELKQASAYRYTEELTKAGATDQVARPGGAAKNYVLTEYGQSVADLGMLFQQWFQLWPYEPDGIEMGSHLAQEVIKSKVEGWGPQILWQLERGPQSMGWLESSLGSSREAKLWGFGSAAKIRRRVRVMEQTGQIEAVDPGARPVAYRPTGWSYRGAGCLAFAIANEEYYKPPACKPPSVRVIAFGLVQAGYVLRAAPDVTGVIEVRIPVEEMPKPIVIHYEIVNGRMRRWGWKRARHPRVVGQGPLMHWLKPLVGLGEHERAEVRGDEDFFRAVIAGVKQGLFAPDDDF